jgi:hypothetical protein
MPQESTMEYNMENWREATKDWTFMPYFIEGYGELLGTIFVGDASEKSYERADFERDLRKVCRPVKNKK